MYKINVQLWKVITATRVHVCMIDEVCVEGEVLCC